MRHLIGDRLSKAGSAPKSIRSETLKFVARPNRRSSGAILTHRRVSAVLSAERRHISCFKKMNMLGIEPSDLLLEHFFDLSDLFFNFASVFFGVAFGLQVWIIRNFTGRLFDFAFHFMNSAFNLILRTRVHLVFSLSLNSK